MLISGKLCFYNVASGKRQVNHRWKDVRIEIARQIGTLFSVFYGIQDAQKTLPPTCTCFFF